MWWARKLMPTISVRGFRATSSLHEPPRYHADDAHRSGISAYITNTTNWYVFLVALWPCWITPNNWQLDASRGTIIVCAIYDVSRCPARTHISPPIMFPAPTRRSSMPLLQQITMPHHTEGTPLPTVSMNSVTNCLALGRMDFWYSTEPAPISWHCRRVATRIAQCSVPILPMCIPLHHQPRSEPESV